MSFKVSEKLKPSYGLYDTSLFTSSLSQSEEEISSSKPLLLFNDEPLSIVTHMYSTAVGQASAATLHAIYQTLSSKSW